MKFRMPKDDMNDDEHIKTGGEDHLPQGFKLLYNGESPEKVDVPGSKMVLRVGKKLKMRSMKLILIRQMKLLLSQNPLSCLQ